MGYGGIRWRGARLADSRYEWSRLVRQRVVRNRVFAERTSAVRLLDFAGTAANPEVAVQPCSFRLFAVSGILGPVGSAMGPLVPRRFEEMSAQDGHRVPGFEPLQTGLCRQAGAQLGQRSDQYGQDSNYHSSH